MNSIIISLFEGDYVLGVGALVNSLYRHGFRGRVYCGHKGPLLFWSKDAAPEGPFRVLRPAEGLELRFFPIDHPWHLTNLKPHMMLKVWEEWEPDAEAVFYFDPDITVKCRWSFFEEWVGYGVALCEEIVMANMPEDHPLRCAWVRWAAGLGWQKVRDMRGVLNGGFVGVTAQQRDFLELWRHGMDCLGTAMPLDRFTPGDRTQPFNMTDQDMLNVMLSVYSGSLSRMGPEGMDFRSGGAVMSHAAGGAKPWRKRYLRSALVGVPPTQADKNWLNNTHRPVPVLAGNQRFLLQSQVRVASALGRLIRRA